MASYSIFDQRFFKYKVENHEKYKHQLLLKYDIDDAEVPDEWNCNSKRIFVSENDVEDIFRPVLTSFCYEIKKSAAFHDFECWINFYEKNTFQEIHNHPNSQLALLYFLKYDPKNDGQFYFYDDKSSLKDITQISELLENIDSFQSCFYPNVKEGDIIIFPSYLLHGVKPHCSNNLRITLSANLKFTL